MANRTKIVPYLLVLPTPSSPPSSLNSPLSFGQESNDEKESRLVDSISY